MDMKSAFPDVDTLLKLQREEVGALLLRYMTNANLPSLVRYNIVGLGSPDVLPYAGRDRVKQVMRKLSEAWAWLAQEGLIAPEPENITFDSAFITDRGKRLTQEPDLRSYQHGHVLRAEGLDPVLAEKVTHLFLRGDCDAAVFQAYREVEVRVRRAASMPSTSLGVTLMFDAFKVPDGPLCPTALPKGEQEAMRMLFAGAVDCSKILQATAKSKLNQKRRASSYISPIIFFI